jgi:hypothetical protein
MECTLIFHRVRRSIAGRTGAMLVGLTSVLAAVLSAQAFAATPAKVAQVPDFAIYNGKQLPISEVFAKELSCNLVTDTLTCFDTQAAARTALGETALACAPLQVFDNATYGGGSISITTSGWTGLGFLANKVSSWKTGCKHGKLLDVPTGTPLLRSPGTEEVVPAFINNLADSVWRS